MKEQSSFREQAKLSQRILRTAVVAREFSNRRCLMNTLESEEINAIGESQAEYRPVCSPKHFFCLPSCCT